MTYWRAMLSGLTTGALRLFLFLFCFFCFLTPGSCRNQRKSVAGGGAIELVSKTGSISIGKNLFQK